MSTLNETHGLGWDWASNLGGREVCVAIYKGLIALCGAGASEAIRAAVAREESRYGTIDDYARLTKAQRYCLAAARRAHRLGSVREGYPPSEQTLSEGGFLGGSVYWSDETITAKINAIGVVGQWRRSA